MKNNYRILVIGESWHGSDCTGLARGFRELGHSVSVIGVNQFLPRVDRSIPSRLLRRAISPYFIRQFNIHIVEQLSILKPDFVVVFKGNNVKPSTLAKIQANKTWLCNFYPDVSFMSHKSVDPAGFKYYHHIFTTKSFGIRDFREYLGLENVSYLPHGFDHAVHRPLNAGPTLKQDVDVSFIGTQSTHKQDVLLSLRSQMNLVHLCIWGEQWDAALKNPLLQDAIMGHAAMGDFYALAIGSSKINLGLLSEKAKGASMGDQITSRTFHIPASGGFLLHERTDEVLQYFEEGKEMACFSTSEELVENVQYYLAHESERLQIAKAGYERCIKENSLINRARVIIDKYESEIE